jgi:hypothetical protein
MSLCAPSAELLSALPHIDRKVPELKIKNPLTRKKGALGNGYSKELSELQDTLRDVVSLHEAEKPAVTQPEEEALSASREKQALLLERVAEIAARAASTVRNGSEAGAGVSNGMQVYYNENPPPPDPVEEGFEFFKISFKNESRAEVIAETYREGQLSMGIYHTEEDSRTFRAVFSRTDGLPIKLPLEGDYSFIYGMLHAEPRSWTWDIADKLRRRYGREKLDSTKFQKIYRHGATIFIGVKPVKE